MGQFWLLIGPPRFDDHSKVLKFITFEGRYFSKLIAQISENELISVGYMIN